MGECAVWGQAVGADVSAGDKWEEAHGPDSTFRPQGLKTGSFFYPGGNVTYQGEAVTLSRKEGILHNYKDEAEWRANIDTVMKWFTDEGLDLVTLYFGEPDSTGHRYGPESQERKEIVMQVDRTVGYLRDSIRKSGLESSLDLLIVSDHGMTTVNKTASDLVEFHKFSNFSFKDIEFELLDYGPNGMLLPKEGMLEKVYEALKDAHPRLHVYKKEFFPKSLHYANHSRITPLLMFSDPGYVIHGVSSRVRARLCPAESLSGSVESTPLFLVRPQLEACQPPKGHTHTMRQELGCVHALRTCVPGCACTHVFVCARVCIG